MANCRGCGRDIQFVKTPAGKSMPVDPGPIALPVPEGTVVKIDDQLLVMSGGQMVVGFRPHWASCPVADRFKRKEQA